MTVPPETQTGQTFRLRGRGVKSVRSGRIGDLMCQVVVETPVRLTREQRELLEQPSRPPSRGTMPTSIRHRPSPGSMACASSGRA